MGIICPPGWDRVNWSAKSGGAMAALGTTPLPVAINSATSANQNQTQCYIGDLYIKTCKSTNNLSLNFGLIEETKHGSF